MIDTKDLSELTRATLTPTGWVVALLTGAPPAAFDETVGALSFDDLVEKSGCTEREIATALGELLRGGEIEETSKPTGHFYLTGVEL